MLKIFGELMYSGKKVATLDSVDNIKLIQNELRQLTKIEIFPFHTVDGLFKDTNFKDFDLFISSQELNNQDMRKVLIEAQKNRLKEVPLLFIFDRDIQCNDWDYIDEIDHIFYDYLERDDLDKKLKHRVDLLLKFSNILNMFQHKSEQDIVKFWNQMIQRDRFMQATIMKKYRQLK